MKRKLLLFVISLILILSLTVPAVASGIQIPVSNNVHAFSAGDFKIDLNKDLYVGTINVGWNGNASNNVDVSWIGNQGEVTITPYTIDSNKQQEGVLEVAIAQTESVQTVVFTLTRVNEKTLEAVVSVPEKLTNDEKAVSLVSINSTMASVSFLSKTIGVRLRGTPNEARAIDWMVGEFAKAGLQTQKYEFSASSATQNIGSLTIYNSEKFYGLGAFDNGKGGPYQKWHGNVWQTGFANSGTLTGPDAEISGEVVVVSAPGIAPTAEAFAAAKGKIALIGVTANATYAAMAISAEATGLMGYTTSLGGRGNHSQAGNPNIGTTVVGIPVLGLARCQGEWLTAMSQQETVMVDIKTERIDTPVSWNAIGVKPAKINPETAPIFIVTGHIDSVLGAPGANDNASGASVTLEAARALMQLDTDKVELRFIAFGHEESGLRGSAQYVTYGLTAEEKARVKGVFNMDMTGSQDEARATYWCMMTTNGQPNLVTDTFMATAGRLGYNEYLHQGQFSSSDHVAFSNAGMPAAMGMWFGRPEGGADKITPLNYTIEAVYHTPLDTIEDNVSVPRMKMCIEVVTAAVYDMALNYDASALRPSSAPLAVEGLDTYILTGEYIDTQLAALAAAEAEAAAKAAAK